MLHYFVFFVVVFLKILFIYLLESERERNSMREERVRGKKVKRSQPDVTGFEVEETGP